MKAFLIGIAVGIVVAVGIIVAVIAIAIHRIDLNKYPMGKNWHD